MKTELKKEAIRLRKRGSSLGDIAKRIKVSKASASVWVRNVELTNFQKEILKKRGSKFEVVEKRRRARIKNEEEKRNFLIRQSGKEITSISKKELKIVGAMLYWAEGRKKGVRSISFSNSDPIVIRVMMRFFREVCKVEEAKFRAHVHTFSHVNVKKSEKFWSQVTGIPLKQFHKTYAKPSVSSSQKMDSLPFGTLDVSVYDVKLFLRVIGLIKKISALVLETKYA